MAFHSLLQKSEELQWMSQSFLGIFFSPLPPALCNSIAIFSIEGSSPKNVCVLELWFLESPEQNRVVSDDKSHSMFLHIFVILRELYWRIHSNRQEMSDRGVLHPQQHEDLTIMLLHYVMMSFCLIISVLSAVLREVAWQNKLLVIWKTWTSLKHLLKPQHPSVFASVWKPRITYLMYFSRMLWVEILRTKNCGGTTVT